MNYMIIHKHYPNLLNYLLDNYLNIIHYSHIYFLKMIHNLLHIFKQFSDVMNLYLNNMLISMYLNIILIIMHLIPLLNKYLKSIINYKFSYLHQI